MIYIFPTLWYIHCARNFSTLHNYAHTTVVLHFSTLCWKYFSTFCPSVLFGCLWWVLGHGLRMHTKYITSCVRPQVWQHLWANCLSKCRLCLLIAWWRIILLPCCLPAHMLNSSQQSGFSGRSRGVSTVSTETPFGTPKLCLLSGSCWIRVAGTPKGLVHTITLYVGRVRDT